MLAAFSMAMLATAAALSAFATVAPEPIFAADEPTVPEATPSPTPHSLPSEALSRMGPNSRVVVIDGFSHGCAGDIYRMPNVSPATDGIDHWTLRFIEIATQTPDTYPMPVLPREDCSPAD